MAVSRLLCALWLSSVCVSALPGRFHRLPRQANDSAPTVDLGYATYRGIRLEEAGVDEYLGMRYAQAPLDDLRFRAPQDPLNETEIQDATSVSEKRSNRNTSFSFSFFFTLVSVKKET